MREELIRINDRLIVMNKNNSIELKKHQLIKKIFSKINCFLEIDVHTAYAILRDLKILEKDIENVYLKLLDIEI